MKNLVLTILLLTSFTHYSQTEKDMLDAGIKKNTVKKIIKSFDGDIYAAVDRWALTGSGKLSKKFIKSAEKLGLDKTYLDNKLKEARKVRMAALAAGLAGAAEGYAASQSTTSTSSNKTSNQGSYSNSGGYSTAGAYANPGGYSSSGTSSSTTNNFNNSYVAPTSSSVDVYQKNEYGFEEKTGEIRSNYYGGSDIYQKNEYGFQEKTGELKNNYSGGVDIYQKNEYGFQEKVGEYRKNLSGGFDVYMINSNGFMEKTGSVKSIPNNL